MKLRRSMLLAILGALLLVIAWSVTRRVGDGPTLSSIEADPVHCFEQTNEDGFGDPYNRYTWALRSFQGYLFAGTYNLVVGEEAGPLEAAGSVEMDLDTTGWPSPAGDPVTGGGELWRWDGVSWQRVAEPGFGVDGNEGIRNLVVHDGALYAGTCSVSTGCQLWRTTDGTSWSCACEPGFTDPRNVSVRGMASWRGALWVGTENKVMGGELWRLDEAGWALVADRGITEPSNRVLMTLLPTDAALFIGTYNKLHGAEVLAYDGTSFTPLVGDGGTLPGGFGDVDNEAIVSMIEFQGQLYVGTANFGSFQLWRMAPDGSWSQVGEDGFGDGFARYAWSMVEHGDQLYMGTWRRGIIGEAWRIGGTLWRTPDGEAWTQVVGPRGELAPAGFGDDLNYGFRTLEVYAGDLYVGTAQSYYTSVPPITGTEVWRRIPDCSPPPPTCGGIDVAAIALVGLAPLLAFARRGRRTS